MLLLLSPAAFAHGISASIVGMLLILYSTAFLLGQAILIIVLRRMKLFKHRWLITASFIASLINALIWGLVLFVVIYGAPELLRDDKLITLVVFVMVIINLSVIVWTFKSPSKQWHELEGQPPYKAENTINEALGIKGKE